MMGRIIKAYRRGHVVSLDVRIKHGYRKWRRIRGQVVGEQRNFIIIQTPHYRECVSKDVFRLDEAKLLSLTINREVVA